MALEQKLHRANSCKLSLEDVSKVLLQENIIKYKLFVYSSWSALVDKCGTCFKRAMHKRKQKMMLLYREGERRIKSALDVRKVIKTQNELNLLKHLLFRKQARMLLRLQRQNLLEFGGSESDESSLNDEIDDLKEDKVRQRQFIDNL